MELADSFGCEWERAWTGKRGWRLPSAWLWPWMTLPGSQHHQRSSRVAAEEINTEPTSKQTNTDQKWSWVVLLSIRGVWFRHFSCSCPSPALSEALSAPHKAPLWGGGSDSRQHTTALLYILTEVHYVRSTEGTKQRIRQGVNCDSWGDWITGIISLPFLILSRGLSDRMFPHW